MYFHNADEIHHQAMAPKVKKTAQQDEKLQAVVLTDSFETRFSPLTATKPRCLLPLVNVPLIEYTMEFLANAGISEIFLVCSSHADQIQEYIEKSKWDATVILSLESRSIGDAMRDIDNRGLITGDFLLVTGDIVTNVDFKKVYNFHKSKKEQDKDYMMTMILTQASPLHRARSHIDPAAFVLDNRNDKCIYYQDLSKSSIDIDPELIEDVDEFVIRNDLIDCHVDICSPHVPQIFQENFDYQYLRSDFLRGVLTSDLLKKTVYTFINQDYSARVESWGTYDAVSKDVLARWCYPMVPDVNLTDTSYSFEFNNIYKEEKVLLAQSCKIGTSVAIGRNSKVGDGSSIKKSVIGRNCVIGKNVSILDSYIWDDSVIEDGATIESSIVASSGYVKESATISNSVVGFDVTVDAGANITNSKISKDDGVEIEGMLSRLKLLNHSDESIASVTKKKKRTHSRTRRFSSNSMMSEPEEDFSVEGVATVCRAIENNHDIDTALLELNTLRMSMNVNYHDVRSVTTEAILKKIVDFVSTDTLKPQEAATKLFSHWGKMYRRQTFTAEEEVDLLDTLEEQIADLDPEYQQVVLFCALKTLYDLEIVEEENILKWWNKGDEGAQVRGLASKFINWLEEAEEDSDEEEE